MGCDLTRSSPQKRRSDFNPRIPYGMRHRCSSSCASDLLFQSTHPVWDATHRVVPQGDTHTISIHASRMGCDPRSRPTSPRSTNFNPRIPYGMRLPFAMFWPISSLFQSTHPVWDATQAGRPVRCVHGISIHASRMGCDLKTDYLPVPMWVFQSTHPVWDATRQSHRHSASSHISIHASRMGCDSSVTAQASSSMAFQSTHPVWDATLSRRHDSNSHPYFNPRIPYGMRPGVVESMTQTFFIFQSTHPVWDATVFTSVKVTDAPISIHASRMGCDKPTHRNIQKIPNFNPRIPYGMRPTRPVFVKQGLEFQSTHPVWDATFENGVSNIRVGISIHASRMGCDLRGVRLEARLGISIHASRMGCDASSRRRSQEGEDFNPRIPYGMRPPPANCWKVPSVFQSTHPVWDATRTDRQWQQLDGISIHASRMGCDSGISRR